MPPYRESFPVGTLVRVAGSDELAEFARSWKLHNPLTEEQMPYAGHAARVTEVGFYHGGDVLYSLDGIPGTWHEQCLKDAG